MTATHQPTRAEIAAKIKALRDHQQRLPEHARDHDAAIGELLDLLLAGEPEPA